MIAKALRNPELRTKFKVGDRVEVPRDVWRRFISKLVCLYPIPAAATVVFVGDKIIQLGKNRKCKFCVMFSDEKFTLLNDKPIWEEWMLEKIKVISTLGSDMRAIKNANPP